MFALGRIPGWVVHAMDQAASNVLLRPAVQRPCGPCLYAHREARVSIPETDTEGLPYDFAYLRLIPNQVVPMRSAPTTGGMLLTGVRLKDYAPVNRAGRA